MDGTVYHGMYASGNVTFTRYSEDDTEVYYSGTISTTMDSRGQGHYSDPITAKMFRGGTLIDSWKVGDYPPNSYDYNTKSISIGGQNSHFTLNDNTTEVTIVYYCNYGGVEGGCDTGTPECTTFRLPAGTLNYVQHKTPSISLSLPDNVGQWTRQGSSTSIRCVWNRNGDPHQHNIYLSKAGTQIYNVNSDAGNDDFTVSYDTPTNRDTTYEVYGKITDNSDGNYWAEARYSRGVFGLPTISVSVANSNKIVAGSTNKITVNTGSLTNDTGSPTTIWIEVNGTKVKEWTNQSTGSAHTLTYDYTPTSDSTTYNVVAKVRHRLFWRRK